VLGDAAGDGPLPERAVRHADDRGGLGGGEEFRRFRQFRNGCSGPFRRFVPEPFRIKFEVTHTDSGRQGGGGEETRPAARAAMMRHSEERSAGPG
jgi:hypothetical protein